jgi:carbon monoxide dehydrogenase subunit G
MKLNGTHKFKASSAQVFNAILDPAVLKSAIPGCNSVAYTTPNQIEVEITTPLPGLHGPFPVEIDIANKQAPSSLELRVELEGKPGSVKAVSMISIADEADGALLTYDANAELTGVLAVANNPIGQPVVKSSLNSFFNNLEKAVETSHV